MCTQFRNTGHKYQFHFRNTSHKYQFQFRNTSTKCSNHSTNTRYCHCCGWRDGLHEPDVYSCGGVWVQNSVSDDWNYLWVGSVVTDARLLHCTFSTVSLAPSGPGTSAIVRFFVRSTLPTQEPRLLKRNLLPTNPFVPNSQTSLDANVRKFHDHYNYSYQN